MCWWMFLWEQTNTHLSTKGQLEGYFNILGSQAGVYAPVQDTFIPGLHHSHFALTRTLKLPLFFIILDLDAALWLSCVWNKQF